MVSHHPLDILIVVTLENASQLISAAKSGLRFPSHLTVSCSANDLGDWRQTTFYNLDNLRAEGSPNRFRDVVAGTDESLESGIDVEKIGFGLSQSYTGACYLSSPVPNDRGDACHGDCDDKDQRQRVQLNTSEDSMNRSTRLNSLPRSVRNGQSG